MAAWLHPASILAIVGPNRLFREVSMYFPVKMSTSLHEPVGQNITKAVVVIFHGPVKFVRDGKVCSTNLRDMETW